MTGLVEDLLRVVVVDLDSTLCDTRPRQDVTPYTHPETTWHDYSMRCHLDEPVAGMVALLRLLRVTSQVYLLSGRYDTATELTTTWLKANEVEYDHLELRPTDDEVRSPSAWKVEVIKRWQSAGLNVVLCIDDWPEICEAVQEECGVPCVNVSPPGTERDRGI